MNGKRFLKRRCMACYLRRLKSNSSIFNNHLPLIILAFCVCLSHAYTLSLSLSRLSTLALPSLSIFFCFAFAITRMFIFFTLLSLPSSPSLAPPSLSPYIYIYIYRISLSISVLGFTVIGNLQMAINPVLFSVETLFPLKRCYHIFSSQTLFISVFYMYFIILFYINMQCECYT